VGDIPYRARVGELTDVGVLLDQIAVATLVIASAGFACYRLGPASVRLWMRRVWARMLGKPLPVAATGTTGGCGDCASAKPPNEARIPATNIRKFERRN
jgi:hypothetical protein